MNHAADAGGLALADGRSARKGRSPEDAPATGGEAAASSLVPSHQTVGDDGGVERCLNGPPDLRLWCPDTGEVRMVPCRRLRCRPCLLWAGWRRGLAIADAGPERFITFTLVGEDWQVVRARMKRVRYDLVREVGACDWVWSVEQNPAGTGHHVHAWQRGDFLPQARLSEIADFNGMGFRVDVRKWHAAGKGAEAYGLKGIGYGLKGSAGLEAAATFLAVNGNRLTHQSAGFFVGGVRAAEARGVARARAAGEQREWVLVNVADLAEATAPAPRLTRKDG